MAERSPADDRPPLRFAVTGGRGYGNKPYVWAAWDRVLRERGPFILVSGQCETGADRFSEEWAGERGITVDPFPAKWDDTQAPGAVVRRRRNGQPYNLLAGFWRNQEMVDSGLDGCVAFPGGTGTADMVRRCEAAGVKVWKPYG